jgi:NitT/TauT family transport system substrate-binding protein
MKMRRGRGNHLPIRFAIALLALSLAGAGCASDASSNKDGSSAGKLTKVRFFKAVSWDAGTAGLFFGAQDEGYFKAEGIEVQSTVGQGGATSVAGLVSGSADIAQAAPDAFMSAVGQGADLVAVWQWLKPGIFGTLVNSDAGINSVADLKGKKIGIIGKSSSTYFSPLVQLQEQGLTEGDVKFVAIGCCSAQYTALKNGQVDAVGTWDANYLAIQQTAAKDGAKAWFDRTKIFWNQNYPSDVLITTRSYLEHNRDTVIAFLRAFKKGEEYQARDPQGALKHAAAHVSGISADDPNNIEIIKLRTASFADGTFDYDSLEKAFTLMFQINHISVDPSSLDLTRLFDPGVPKAVNGG